MQDHLALDTGETGSSDRRRHKRATTEVPFVRAPHWPRWFLQSGSVRFEPLLRSLIVAIAISVPNIAGSCNLVKVVKGHWTKNASRYLVVLSKS